MNRHGQANDGFVPHYQPAVSGPTLDVGRCFAEAIDVYRRNFGVLVTAAGLSILHSVITLSLMVGPLCGGWTLMSLDALCRRDRKVRLALILSQGNRIAPFASLAFRMSFWQVLGLLSLLLPGVLLTTNWLLSYPLIVDRGLSPAAAMDKSRRIVDRRGFLPHLALGSAVVVLNILPAIVPILGWIVGCFTMPLGWLLVAAAYLQDVHEHSTDLGDIFPRGFEVPYAAVATPSGATTDGRACNAPAGQQNEAEGTAFH